MIRRFRIEDLDAVMALWLEANLSAHDFIEADYWREHYPSVRALLPDAALTLYEEDGVVLGFVGLVEDAIAGILVGAGGRSRGIGRALLNHIKGEHTRLHLTVYQKNGGARRFYLREGFSVLGEQRDAGTGEIELMMAWKR